MWISRANYEQAIDNTFRDGQRSRDAEVASLTAMLRESQETVRRLVEHRVRVERRRAGLPEIQPEKRPPPQPMSDELRRYLDGWNNPAYRVMLENRAKGMLGQGMPSEDVLGTFQREQGG